jgi:hypothetical protein
MKFGESKAETTSKRPIAAAALLGIASGVALGAIVGPVGVGLGVGLGVAIGIFAGHALAREEAKKSRRTRELDAIIGITQGTIGAGRVLILPVDEEIARRANREAWAAEWLTPPPPMVR